MFVHINIWPSVDLTCFETVRVLAGKDIFDYPGLFRSRVQLDLLLSTVSLQYRTNWPCCTGWPCSEGSEVWPCCTVSPCCAVSPCCTGWQCTLHHVATLSSMVELWQCLCLQMTFVWHVFSDGTLQHDAVLPISWLSHNVRCAVPRLPYSRRGRTIVVDDGFTQIPDCFLDQSEQSCRCQ